MIHLVIDTTALRNDPARNKAAFRSLKRLAKAGELRLHVPHVVMEEFLSQQIEQYVAGLSEIKTLVVKFKKKHMPDLVRVADHGKVRPGKRQAEQGRLLPNE